MNPLAKMGIPNLAEYGRCSQECQSGCKLAMSQLAIYLGYHRATSRGGRSADRGGLPSLPARGFPLAAADRIPRNVRDPDAESPIRSSMSYSYAQFLSSPQLAESMTFCGVRRASR